MKPAGPEADSSRRGWMWLLALFAAPLLLGAVMQADAGRATLLGVEGPPCPLGSVLGEEVCPGCGLTRSTTMVVHGRWDGAFALNPAGFAVVGLCGLGCAAVLVGLWRGGRPRELARWARWVFLLGVLFGWGCKLWRAGS